MPDTPDWVTSLRESLPVVRRYAYLNTGTAGPVPALAANASAAEAARELEYGRGNLAEWSWDLFDDARALAARVLGARAEEVALTHHTSDGINIVLAGIEWKPEDEVVTTTLEHDAVAVPFGLLRQRHGVLPRFADVGRGERCLEGIRDDLTGKTRLVVLSHVAYSTGALLPVAEVVELCHRAGALVLVDGAQSCGALPVDVHALGADFYTLSGQKWLCGPEGTGALYLRPEAMDAIQPTFVSYFSARSHDFRGHVALQESARRFESAMLHRPSLAGLGASLTWMLEEVGIERAWIRSRELAELARERLLRVDGITMVTPEEIGSQLLTFDLPAFPRPALRDVVGRLARQHRILIRSIDHPPFGLRASFGFFNTAAEVHQLARAIEEVVRDGPG